jgi:hypothetical protein
MASLLSRYERGDCRNVWQELHSMQGVTLLAENDYRDVVQVVEATTKRVRHNVEALYDYLLESDFEFEMPDVACIPANAESLRVTKLLEDNVGALPLLFRAWIAEVGNVCFRGKPRPDGTHAAWRKAMLDPLEFLYSYEATIGMLEERIAANADFEFEFAGDTYIKNGFSGGMPAQVILTRATPDAWIVEDRAQATRDGVWFVDYLREYFSSFGFRSTALSTDRSDSFFQNPPSLLSI